GEAAARDPLVPVAARLRQLLARLLPRRGRQVVAPAERAEAHLALAHARLGAGARPLEAEPQVGAQAQLEPLPLGRADAVAVPLAGVLPRAAAAAVVERRLAVELDVDEAVEAPEHPQQ